jgi:hypothetical protein
MGPIELSYLKTWDRVSFRKYVCIFLPTQWITSKANSPILILDFKKRIRNCCTRNWQRSLYQLQLLKQWTLYQLKGFNADKCFAPLCCSSLLTPHLPEKLNWLWLWKMDTPWFQLKQLSIYTETEELGFRYSSTPTKDIINVPHILTNKSCKSVHHQFDCLNYSSPQFYTVHIRFRINGNINMTEISS